MCLPFADLNSFYFFIFIYLLSGVGAKTQGLTHARQVLNHRATPSPNNLNVLNQFVISLVYEIRPWDFYRWCFLLLFLVVEA
jgi:hypothetical protein